MPRGRKILLASAAAALAAGMGYAPAALGAPAAPATRATVHTASVMWSRKMGPVPRVASNTAPALTILELPGGKTDTVLFWTGPAAHSGFQISYQRAISLSHNTWSLPGLVDRGAAVTDSAPSAAPFGGTSAGRVIVAWREPGTGQVMYSAGSAAPGGLSWGPAFPIPGAVTSAGPTVFSPFHSSMIIATWKSATSGAVDFALGSPAGNTGKVQWGKAGTIPGAVTTGSPAVAEVSTGAKTGTLFVLWKGPGSDGPIDRASTPDPPSGQPVWTGPVAFPKTVMTAAAPAGQEIGTGRSYPLLVVYRALHSSRLLEVQLAASGKVSLPQLVPALTSQFGPALFHHTLAATAPDPGKVFFITMIHPCAGC